MNRLYYSPELQWSQRGLVAEDGVPSGVAAAAASRQAAWVAVAASERGEKMRAWNKPHSHKRKHTGEGLHTI